MTRFKQDLGFGAVFLTPFCFSVPASLATGKEKAVVAVASPSAAELKARGESQPPRVARDLLGGGIDETAVLRSLGPQGKLSTSPRGDGGQRHNVALRETPFTYAIMIADAEGKVRRMSAFVRPGEEIPFEKLGDTASASKGTAASLVWDMIKEGPGRNYRLVVQGRDQKAQVIFLIGAPKRGAELNDTIELPSPSPARTKKR